MCFTVWASSEAPGPTSGGAASTGGLSYTLELAAGEENLKGRMPREMFSGLLLVGEERIRGTKGPDAGSRSDGCASSREHPLLWERDSGRGRREPQQVQRGKRQGKGIWKSAAWFLLGPLGKKTKTKNHTPQMHNWGGSAGEGNWAGRLTSTHMHARTRTHAPFKNQQGSMWEGREDR